MDRGDLTFLKFNPIIKDKVWGGKKLREFLRKEAGDKAGESWELSGVEGSVSTVSEGHHEGTSLQDLISMYRGSLVGDRVFAKYGEDFPLLFKFIDASDDLSVQLHPNDDLAKQRHNSFGKTEMWYIVDRDQDSRLILGFNKTMDAKSYQTVMDDGTLTKVLHEEPVNPGDSYFIKTGTVHAIGAGILLAEIQQTSDITYRIYDWDRPDSDGNYRELHTQEALEAIDYNAPGAKLNYDSTRDEVVNICTSDYFVTNRLELTESMKRSHAALDSFVVYMCIEGSASLVNDSSEINIDKGETVLVPACLTELELRTQGAVLLEIHIP